MNKDAFWVFGSLGLGDHLVMNALYRHYAELHKDKFVIIPIWEHNQAAVQFMLSDVHNIFFYPIDREETLLNCRKEIHQDNSLGLGFYSPHKFNPVLWDSEFYRQAGLDPELKWSGFKLPEFDKGNRSDFTLPLNVCHEDKDRGFEIHTFPTDSIFLGKHISFQGTVRLIYNSNEIHCIDSSMLNLADLMETPYCKRFVFHKYARRGLPPTLHKPWEILD